MLCEPRSHVAGLPWVLATAPLAPAITGQYLASAPSTPQTGYGPRRPQKRVWGCFQRPPHYHRRHHHYLPLHRSRIFALTSPQSLLKARRLSYYYCMDSMRSRARWTKASAHPRPLLPGPSPAHGRRRHRYQRALILVGENLNTSLWVFGWAVWVVSVGGAGGGDVVKCCALRLSTGLVWVR